MNPNIIPITDKDSNIINAIDFAKNEYSKFKRLFLQTAEESSTS